MSALWGTSVWSQLILQWIRNPFVVHVTKTTELWACECDDISCVFTSKNKSSTLLRNAVMFSSKLNHWCYTYTLSFSYCLWWLHDALCPGFLPTCWCVILREMVHNKALNSAEDGRMYALRCVFQQHLRLLEDFSDFQWQRNQIIISQYD